MTEEPHLIQGKAVVDDRGTVRFVNDFTFDSVKRFYTVSNHAPGFVRAWHGHRHEAKFCTAIGGSFLVCCVRVDDWNSPSTNLPIHRFVLSDQTPAVLYVPAGYANGFKSLTADATILFFSSARLEDSLGDDIRFPARLWNPWDVVER